MANSFTVGGLELIGTTTNPEYRLGRGMDGGAITPDTVTLSSLSTDGDWVSGKRTGNKAWSFTVLVSGADRPTLSKNVNTLLAAISADTVATLLAVWTPSGCPPTVFTAFRATATPQKDMGKADQGYAEVLVQFATGPFGESATTVSVLAPAAGGAIQTQIDGMNAGSFTNATLDTSVKYEGAGSARVVLNRIGTGPTYRFDTPTTAPGRSIATTDLSAYGTVSTRFRWPAPANFAYLTSRVSSTLLLGSASGSSFVTSAYFGVTTGDTSWHLVSFDLSSLATFTGSGVDLTAVTSWALGIDAGPATPPLDGMPATSTCWFDDLRAYPTASTGNSTGEGSVLTIPAVKGSARTPVALTATRTVSGGSVGTPALRTAQVTQTTEAALTTASFTPTASELLVAVVALGTSASAGATTLAISDTLGGLTWTQVTANKGAVGNETIASIFYATAPGSPTAGTVTVTPSRTGVADGATLNIYGISGASAIGATGTSATGGLSVTLSAAPAATSMVLGLYTTILGSDPVTTVPAGHTGLFTDQHVGSVTYVTASYDNGSASQTLTWGGTNTGNSAIVALEITKAAGTAGTFTNLLLHAPPGDQDPDATILAGLSSGSVTIPAANMNYDDTFSIALLLSATAGVGVSRVVTVTLTQKLGATTVGTQTFTTTIVGTQTIMPLGSLVTLPLVAQPPENRSGSLVIAVSSTNGTDVFSDVALCSTSGQTVLLTGLAAVAAVYVDKPDATVGIGPVYSSTTDRTGAISAMGQLVAYQGPVQFEPGANRLLAASTSGAPDITATWTDRWLDEAQA